MNPQQTKIRQLAMAAAVLTAAVAAGTPAQAGASTTDPVGAVSQAEYVPFVTDFAPGVFRELEQRRAAREPFVPGVTDSTTGVLRELERKGLAPPVYGPRVTAAESGFPTAVVVAGGTAVAAAILAAAFLPLLMGGRRRRGLPA